VEKLKTTPKEEIRKNLEDCLMADILDDSRLSQYVPNWEGYIGDEAFQHDGRHLGEHIKIVLMSIKYLKEYSVLSEDEKRLALISVLFHDLGKPLGKRGAGIKRDYNHEKPSAEIAVRFLKKNDYPDEEVKIVKDVILYHSVVSDIASGKVRDQEKNFSPKQLKEQINNLTTIRILRAVNRADAIAAIGLGNFSLISKDYNNYFDEISKEFSSV
jgi:UTP:GlnB (protein PII) uridylyltransferase